MGEEITFDSKFVPFVPFVPTFWNIEIAVATFRLTLPKKIAVHYFFSVTLYSEKKLPLMPVQDPMQAKKTLI